MIQSARQDQARSPAALQVPVSVPVGDCIPSISRPGSCGRHFYRAKRQLVYSRQPEFSGRSGKGFCRECPPFHRCRKRTTSFQHHRNTDSGTGHRGPLWIGSLGNGGKSPAQVLMPVLQGDRLTKATSFPWCRWSWAYAAVRFMAHCVWPGRSARVGFRWRRSASPHSPRR